MLAIIIHIWVSILVSHISHILKVIVYLVNESDGFPRQWNYGQGPGLFRVHILNCSISMALNIIIIIIIVEKQFQLY